MKTLALLAILFAPPAQASIHCPYKVTYSFATSGDPKEEAKGTECIYVKNWTILRQSDHSVLLARVRVLPDGGKKMAFALRDEGLAKELFSCEQDLEVGKAAKCEQPEATLDYTVKQYH